MKDKKQNELTLKRELGLTTSTLLVAGLVIGSGIFKKIIPMSQTGIGEISILLAWAAAGLISLLGALSVGGLASLTEESGGTYEYFKLSYGKFFAFISGWSDFMIIGTGVNAALAFLFAQAVNSLIPLPNPLQSWEHISLLNFIYPFANSGIKIVGIGTIVILTGVNCIGARESGIVNNIITSAKILGILILITFGLTNAKPDVAVAVGTLNSISSPKGLQFLSSFLTAMLYALWAYDGWIYTANISGEIINPKRNVPMALAFGILIAMSLYLLLNYVYMHIIPLETLRSVTDNEIGALVIAEIILGQYGRTLLLILILVCVFGALNSNIISLPRKYYQMAHEGYFFSNAKKIHTRFRTPVVALIYSMIWSCILLFSGSFDMLTDMVVFTAFVFYGLLCLALIKLKRNGTIKVKVVGYPVAPIIFLLFSIVLTVHTIWTEPKKSAFGLILILSSIPFYFFFKYLKENQTVS
jgi:basic amino acid/polyamine antiporter, APA family